MFRNIKGSDSWVNIDKINLGWSNDTKYHIVDKDNSEYILKISSIIKDQLKFEQYKNLLKVNELNLNTSKVIAYGKLNDDEVYTLFTFLEGDDPKESVKNLSKIDQYKLGNEVSKIMKSIHSLEKDTSNEWWEKYQKKISRKIDAFKSLDYPLPYKDKVLEYVTNNYHLMKDRPQVLCHGDFHLGNMLINDNRIALIDFDKFGFADPYDEFKPFCWNVEVSSYFETGIIDGYFNNNIPDDFFLILSFYAAESLISQLPWSIKFGEEETKTALKVYQDVLSYFSNFDNTIPSWYKKNFYE